MTRAEMIERIEKTLARLRVLGLEGDVVPMIYGRLASRILDSLGLTEDSPTAWLAPWEETWEMRDAFKDAVDADDDGWIAASEAWEAFRDAHLTKGPDHGESQG